MEGVINMSFYVVSIPPHQYEVYIECSADRVTAVFGDAIDPRKYGGLVLQQFICSKPF